MLLYLAFFVWKSIDGEGLYVYVVREIDIFSLV